MSERSVKNNQWSTIQYHFLLILIIFLPLQKLFEALVGEHLPGGATFWLSHWYEPVLALIILAGVARLVKSRSCPNYKVFNQPALYLVAFGLVSASFLSSTLSRGLEGFRFALLPVVFLLLGNVIRLTAKQQLNLLNAYLAISLAVAIWGLAERFLPYHYWEIIALSDFGWGKYLIAEKIYQSASFMNGPNQMASYLLPALFIQLNRTVGIIGLRKTLAEVKPKLSASVPAAAVIISAIIFSFSRSAAVGLIISLVVFVSIGKLSRKIKMSFAALFLLILVSAGIASRYFPESWEAIIYHGTSHFGHSYALDLSMEELKSRSFDQLMIGSGLGSAGPAAIKYGDGLVSESWYLQLLLEIGIIGLSLWLWFIADISVRLWRRQQLGLLAGVLSVSIAAIFLHTWADNPAIAITTFVLVSLSLKTSNEAMKQ